MVDFFYQLRVIYDSVNRVVHEDPHIVVKNGQQQHEMQSEQHVEDWDIGDLPGRDDRHDVHEVQADQKSIQDGGNYAKE
jgi:hypothetical protein